jgi:nucleoside-triphosphatase
VNSYTNGRVVPREQKGAKTRLILITGTPGVGKTTLMQSLYDHYNVRGVKVGGFITREVTENGRRVGFRIVDLQSGREGWLAKAQPGSGPMYGRYCIILEDLEAIGIGSLRTAVELDMDMILADEIGPMEMSSRRFSAEISSLFQNTKGQIVATFKQGSHYPMIDKCRDDPTTTLLTITRDNRPALLSQLIEIVDSSLKIRGTRIH